MIAVAFESDSDLDFIYQTSVKTVGIVFLAVIDEFHDMKNFQPCQKLMDELGDKCRMGEELIVSFILVFLLWIL